MPAAAPAPLMVAASLLPPIVVLPITAGVMGLLVWHWASLRRAPHPPSRKRIRSANAMLMLAIVPLFAAGVSLVHSQRQPRLWLLIWLSVICLVWMSVMLALLDMLNTLRIAKARRRDLRGRLLHPRRLRFAARGSDDGE